MAKGTAIDTPIKCIDNYREGIVDKKIKSPYISIARIPTPVLRRYCNLPPTSFTDILG